MKKKVFYGVGAVAIAITGLTMALPAEASLVLTAEGIADGFTLSTFYSEPGAYYGLLDATTTASGNVIATSYARDQLSLFADVDGQTFGTALKTVSVAAYGPAYSVATVGGKTYFTPGGAGGYYS